MGEYCYRSEGFAKVVARKQICQYTGLEDKFAVEASDLKGMVLKDTAGERV